MSANGLRGTKVYLKVHDSNLLAQPNFQARRLGMLTLGAEMTLTGNKTAIGREVFWEVRVVKPTDGRAASPAHVQPNTVGWLLEQNLSKQKVTVPAFRDDGKPMSPQAFPSSGTSAKA